ncbi:MAG: hypothetical protein QOH31_1737 [Verrucomicrobiota bacterium]|jgi:hypothetical protein
MELSVEDTWRSAGMKGIGSNTLIAEEAERKRRSCFVL